MSRLGMKSAIARAIVDPNFREQFVSDMRRAIEEARYDVTDDELEMLKCNTLDSFDPKFVTVETMPAFWKLSEDRINAALSEPRLRSAPEPGLL